MWSTRVRNLPISGVFRTVVVTFLISSFVVGNVCNPRIIWNTLCSRTRLQSNPSLLSVWNLFQEVPYIPASNNNPRWVLPHWRRLSRPYFAPWAHNCDRRILIDPEHKKQIIPSVWQKHFNLKFQIVKISALPKQFTEPKQSVYLEIQIWCRWKINIF